LRITQRHHLGMRATGLLGVTLADDAAFCCGDHTADAGVGLAQADGLLRQVERELHGGVGIDAVERVWVRCHEVSSGVLIEHGLSWRGW
jgi:hypothetical protein